MPVELKRAAPVRPPCNRSLRRYSPVEKTTTSNTPPPVLGSGRTGRVPPQPSLKLRSDREPGTRARVSPNGIMYLIELMGKTVWNATYTTNARNSVRQDVREEANQTVSSINRLTLFLKANSEVHDVDHVEKGAKFSTKLWRLTRVRVYSAETSGTDA